MLLPVNIDRPMSYCGSVLISKQPGPDQDSPFAVTCCYYNPVQSRRMNSRGFGESSPVEFTS